MARRAHRLTPVNSRRRALVLGLPAALLVTSGSGLSQTTPAAPVEKDAAVGKEPVLSVDDRTIVDPSTRRRVLVRLRLPATSEARPLLIYSPGLGSGLSNGAAWCEAW